MGFVVVGMVVEKTIVNSTAVWRVTIVWDKETSGLYQTRGDEAK